MPVEEEAERPSSGSPSPGSTQTLNNGSNTYGAFTGADIKDTNGFHDPAVNNTRLTIPVGQDGPYLLSIQCSANATRPTTVGSAAV